MFVLRQISEGSDCGLVINEREEADLFRKTVLYWRGLALPLHLHGTVARNGGALSARDEAADL